MPGLGDLEALIAQLEAAVAECRTVTAEAHGVSRDLRAAIREARETIDVKTRVDTAIEERVATGLAEYTDTVTAAMDSAVKHILSEFEALRRSIFTGSRGAIGAGGPDLRTTIPQRFGAPPLPVNPLRFDRG